MASAYVKSNRMKGLESKKSHSWWWDSHISPKNSKWLQENLEEMDMHIKRMLKLIEEDADSFAKKAELYFQKRPELTSLVEDFYRMYRSLAERYDHVTGELRKNIPSDLQSQGSGISDVGSEPPSSIPSSDQRPIKRKSSGPRAAGFDYFLGNGSDLNSKEGDESSTLDSESESDDSSVNNYAGPQSHNDDQGLQRKIVELEGELREVKEKLRVFKEEKISENPIRKDESFDFSVKIAKYEEDLQVAKQKIQISEEEITNLRNELQKCKSVGDSDNLLSEEVLKQNQVEVELVKESFGSEAEVLDKSFTLEEELRIVREKLRESEIEVSSFRQEITSKGSSIQNLQDQLKSANKEVSGWKIKLEKEKREVSKLQDRIARYKNNLSERDQEIRRLKEAMSNANKSLSEENEWLKAETTKMLKEKAYLEDNIKELDLSRQSLEEEVRRVSAGKAEAEVVFRTQIEQLKTDMEELSKKHEMLIDEKNNLSFKIDELGAEVSCKDVEIDQMSEHLHQLHMEHVELISGAGEARKLAEELVTRVKELEKEVERKQDMILEGAEEKREVIRQLCLSIEHYRNGYHWLREVVIGHKRMPVMAS